MVVLFQSKVMTTLVFLVNQVVLSAAFSPDRVPLYNTYLQFKISYRSSPTDSDSTSFRNLQQLQLQDQTRKILRTGTGIHRTLVSKLRLFLSILMINPIKNIRPTPMISFSWLTKKHSYKVYVRLLLQHKLMGVPQRVRVSRRRKLYTVTTGGSIPCRAVSVQS